MCLEPTMRFTRFVLSLMLSTFATAASAETTCSFLAFKDGYYKSRTRELPIRFLHASREISLTLAEQPDADTLKGKIQGFLRAKAELDFNELANSPVDGIQSVLIPVTLEEMGVYGKAFFRYVEDTWGSSPRPDWMQYDYYIDDDSVTCR